MRIIERRIAHEEVFTVFLDLGLSVCLSLPLHTRDDRIGKHIKYYTSFFLFPTHPRLLSACFSISPGDFKLISSGQPKNKLLFRGVTLDAGYPCDFVMLLSRTDEMYYINSFPLVSFLTANKLAEKEF